MKPQRSRAERPDAASKVKVLRAYLAKLKDVSTPSFDVDPSHVRGGVHGGGSRLGQVSRFLFPEVILCTDLNDTRAVFIILTSDGSCVDATVEALDAWLQRQEHENASEAVSAALQVVQRAGSRLSNRTDQSRAAKAVNVLRTLLVSDTPAA